MAGAIYLTDKEKELLEALKKHRSMKGACEALGIKRVTGSSRLHRINNKIGEAQQLLDDVKEIKKGLPPRFIRV